MFNNKNTNTRDIPSYPDNTHQPVQSKICSSHPTLVLDSDNVESCNYYDIDSFNSNQILNNGIHNLSLFHLNARSIFSNYEEISTFISLTNIHFSVLGFTETWSHGNINSVLNIPHYNCIESFRSNKRGGGVCLYVSNELPFVKLSNISFFNDSVESLFIEINCDTLGKCTIGVIYRPPNISIDLFNNNLDIIFNTLSSNKNSYIMGDFNVNLFDDNTATNFINAFASNGFSPVITKATRISNHTATLIDNIFTNADCNIISGIFDTDLSDHFPIFLKVTDECRNINPNTPHYVRNFNANNKHRFLAELATQSWDHILDETNVNIAYEVFIDGFTKLYNVHFPSYQISKSKKKKKRHPWITNGILTSIKHKNKLYRKFLRDRTDYNKHIFSQYRNKLTHIIRISKKEVLLHEIQCM